MAKKAQQPEVWFQSRKEWNKFSPVIKQGFTWIDLESIKVYIWICHSKDPISLDVNVHSPEGTYAIRVMYNMS